MVSRIDIGPDGGPYVAINENSNNLELQDINGNVIAKWDETAGQWDLNNNSLTGINAINASSVSTEDADITVGSVGTLTDEDGNRDQRFNRITTQTIENDNPLIFDNLSLERFGKTYWVEISWEIVEDVGFENMFLRFNEDDRNVYDYQTRNLTFIEDGDSFPLARGQQGDQHDIVLQITRGDNRNHIRRFGASESDVIDSFLEGWTPATVNNSLEIIHDTNANMNGKMAVFETEMFSV